MEKFFIYFVYKPFVLCFVWFLFYLGIQVIVNIIPNNKTKLKNNVELLLGLIFFNVFWIAVVHVRKKLKKYNLKKLIGLDNE